MVYLEKIGIYKDRRARPDSNSQKSNVLLHFINQIKGGMTWSQGRPCPTNIVGEPLLPQWGPNSMDKPVTARVTCRGKYMRSGPI